MARLIFDAPHWDEPGLRMDDRLARVPPWAALAAFVALIWLLERVGLPLSVSRGAPPVVRPAAGLLLFALLATRARDWPVVLAAAFLTEGLALVAGGRSGGAAAAHALAFLVEGGGAAWLIRLATPRVTTRTVRGVVALLMGPALVKLPLSTVWRAFAAGRGEPFLDGASAVLALSSLLGIATLGWLAASWVEEAPVQERPVHAVAETVLALVTLGGAVAIIHAHGQLFANEILLVPPVIWLAVRFGPRGASAGVCLATLALVHTASIARGLIPLEATTPVHLALDVQLFLVVVTAPTAFVAAVVAERQTAEEQRLLLARAIDRSADGLGVYEVDGRILWANAASARFFGVAAGDQIGRRVWELLEGESPEKWQRRVARLGEGMVIREERTHGPDGRLVPWEVSSALVQVAGRRLVIAAMRDVTDRQRASEALRLAGIGTLAAGVAHEINNPLASVVGNLALVRERLAAIRERGGPPELTRFVEEWLDPIVDAEDGARRVREVVGELRVFARAEAGRGPMDVARAMRSALSLAQSEIQHRARLVTRIAEVPAVHGSEGRLAQAFANVLVNAARAIPEGASQENEIRVEVRSRDDEVVAEVADTGVGMSGEVRQHIFEPFFTTRGIGEGSGLGLAVTHAIVTAMNGRIDVDSAPGAGTRFRIVLPVAKGVVLPARPAFTPVPGRSIAPAAGPATAGVAAAPPPSRAVAPVAGRLTPVPSDRPRLKLLIVDDEPLVARSLQRILSREHEVDITDRARAALDRIAGGERFDAVLCDLMMPDVNGMAFYDEVGILDPDLQSRVVFVTGGAFTEAARDFLDRVPNRRLEKPVDPGTLRQTVREFTPRAAR